MNDVRVDAVPLAAACDWIEQHGTGQRPHPSTLTRWIHRGVRGRRLPARRTLGGKYVVNLEDVATFIERITGDIREQPRLPAIERAGHELRMRELDSIFGRRAT